MSIGDVRVRDVVESFTLNQQDSQYKYLLRFETVLQISQQKRIVVWMDLDNELDVQAPNVKGKIRVKVLRLPKGVELKELPRPVRPAYQNAPQEVLRSRQPVAPERPFVE